MIGARSGSLTVLAGPHRGQVTVRCECGNTREMRKDWIGRVLSCGCRRNANLAQRSTTHGMSGTPEYSAWLAMRLRCGDPRDNQFKNYGARGIRVCAEWQRSFEAFIAAVGRRPSSQHSLERRDNDGHYEPGNVRWATASEQARNRRLTLRVEYAGQQRVFADLCDEHALPYHIVYQRVYRYGMTLEAALKKAAPKARRLC